MSKLSKINWTNESVLALDSDSDSDFNPIEIIISKSRKLVFQAKEDGWKGPPFNPIKIAEMLGIEIEANSNVKDARLINTDECPIIQFNPMQPRERVRFSIAHEVAHSLFPDWKQEIRHRNGNEQKTDAWQLEMLCNLAAAEMVLPMGSLSPEAETQSIEDLMVKRRQFDVSAEAYLIRTVNISPQPIGLFVASVKRIKPEVQYFIDYYIGSSASPDIKNPKPPIPSSSVVYNCNAIGHTDKANEDWLAGDSVLTECVGLSPYPATVYPRVAGLVKFNLNQPDYIGIKRKHGNVLSVKGSGKILICQLVNDKATRWGGGIAKDAADKFPAAEVDFRKKILKISHEDRLGEVIFTEVSEQITIASLIGQHGFGPSSVARIRYSALQKCFNAVACEARRIGASIHMPKIGTGAAGGDWQTIEEIIDESIIRSGLSVTLYELPPKREQINLF